MKNLAIASAIILLLTGFSLNLPTLAQPTHIPHENPLTAVRYSNDSAAMLAFHISILDQINNGEYLDVQSTLENAKLANIHPRLRSIINTLNRLSSQLAATMNQLEALLHEASTLSSQNRINDARQKLHDARETIRNSQLLLKDIKTTANTLSDSLAAFTSTEQQTKQYYKRFQDSMERISQLISLLNELAETLSESPQAKITSRFNYPTYLEVTTPRSAHPGLPITVSGQVNSNDSIDERIIKLLFDNTPLAEKTVRGQFSLQATLPAQILPGKHSITLVAVPQEHYARASTTLPISITKLPVQAEIQTPQIAILPGQLQLDGQVHYGLSPLQEARVEIDFKGASTTVETDAQGNFSGLLKAPLDLSLIGPQTLTIAIEPVEPWYASAKIKKSVLIINPLSSGLMLAAILSLGLILLRQVKTSPLHLHRDEAAVKLSQPEHLIPTPVSTEETGLDDIQKRILSAYNTGLVAIGEITGISMAPHTTLREYLNAALPRLSNAAKPFSELTALTENALYSAQEYDKNTAKNARGLANHILKEQSSGTA